MSLWLLPVVFAIFIWWFSTGVVILLDGLPHKTFRWSLVISSLLAVGAIAGLIHTASKTTVADSYCAFTCGLLLWGWHELSFLTGWITGPRKQGSSSDCSRGRQAIQAINAILWHELWLLASGLILLWITWGQANQVGLWTFAVLWLMRASAKLNLFLGVRNLGLEFLPSHLSYLQFYFRKAPMNALFPFSVTLATGVTAWLVVGALEPSAGEATRVGQLLVATLLGLAVLEHWMLVIPWSPTALWRWALKSRERASRQDPPAPPGPTSPVLTISADEKLLHAR